MSRSIFKSEPFPDQDRRHVIQKTVQYLVDADSRVVVVHFGRTLTLQDVRTYVEDLRNNPSFDLSFSEIVDLTQVEKVDLQAEEFLKLADKVDPFSTDAKRAFVARTAVQNHAARMHKVLGTDRNIGIFRSMEEAERWVRDSR